MLNKEQRIAVLDDKNNIFLLAGAGTGKTRVITEKIKNILLKGIDPKDILCITFTVKASHEMKLRLSNPDINIYTFHAYCFNVLNDNNNLKIIDNKHRFSQNELLLVSKYKTSMHQTLKPSIYNEYDKYLKDNNFLDYDDLLINALSSQSHQSFKYIFIDEFQDTNPLQFELIKRLVKKDTMIFAVGDPDQSIYKFRGAKVELIEKYIKYFHAVVYKLEYNYRSNENILTAANNLIKNNLNRFKKQLITQKRSVDLIELNIVSDDLLIHKVIEKIKTNKFKKVAILFRNHNQVTKLKQALERHYIFDCEFYSFHESKGLEFETVFIIGAQILPFDKENIFSNKEEERRLLFVGITRAKKNLIIFTNKQTKMLNELKIKYNFIT